MGDPRDTLRVLTWNVYQGRARPPAGRDLQDAFTAALAGWAWDVALLQEVPPWWVPSLAAACGARAHDAPTWRTRLPRVRRALARRWPDVLRAQAGQANVVLVRPRVAGGAPRCGHGASRGEVTEDGVERRGAARDGGFDHGAARGGADGAGTARRAGGTATPGRGHADPFDRTGRRTLRWFRERRVVVGVRLAGDGWGGFDGAWVATVHAQLSPAPHPTAWADTAAALEAVRAWAGEPGARADPDRSGALRRSVAHLRERVEAWGRRARGALAAWAGPRSGGSPRPDDSERPERRPDGRRASRAVDPYAIRDESTPRGREPAASADRMGSPVGPYAIRDESTPRGHGADGAPPLVLGGDLNLRLEHLARAGDDDGDGDGAVPRLPGWRLVGSSWVDHVLVRGPATTADAPEVLERGTLSDHAPLRVTLLTARRGRARPS